MVLDFNFQAVPHVKMWGDKWQKESKAMCVLFLEQRTLKTGRLESDQVWNETMWCKVEKAERTGSFLGS